MTSIRLTRARLSAFATASLLALAGLHGVPSVAGEAAVKIPPLAGEAAVEPKAAEAVAVFAGGCFWGVQGVFQHTRGVLQAVSGYAGGSKATASYALVGSGLTGHAEAVQITYDPKQVSYGQLLQIFFSVVHDPTQLNRQGPDSGPSYRSAIFPQSVPQVRVAHAYIKQLSAARAYSKPIVTRLESGKFYDAERAHQDFMRRNPMHPYILANDVGKVTALKRAMPDLYRG